MGNEMNSIGERIRSTRKAKKMTLTDVAGDAMSAAMVSLIENGKTTPTVQTLNHIANQLDVEPVELMNRLSREELNHQIDQISKLVKVDQQSLQRAIHQMEGLVPNLSMNLESARVYEMLAESLFMYYKFYTDSFQQKDYQNWEEPIHRAKTIYGRLQIVHREAKTELFLIKVDYSHAKYEKTLDRLRKMYDRYSFQSSEMQKVYLELATLEAHTLTALGKWEEALKRIDETIDFSKQHLIFDQFYQLHNWAAYLLLNEDQKKAAEKHLDVIEKFYELTENDTLYIEKMTIQAHYTEFFYNKPEDSLRLIEEAELKLNDIESITEDIKASYLDHLSDLKARCYTKLDQVERALSLFKDHLHSEAVIDHPLDRSLREISHSYRAICYLKKNEKSLARQAAEKAVENLKHYPYTKYYLFAQNVLQEVRSELEKE